MKVKATILAMTFALASATALAQAPKPAAPAPAPAPAQAAPQQMEAPVVAVVDVNEVLQRSKAGQVMYPQFDKLKKGYEDELNKERDAVNAEGQQLDGQRAVLAPEAFAQRVSQLRQKDQALANKVAERKRTLDATLSAGLAQIRNVLFQFSADIARERGINIVLPKEAVVIIARNLEITDEVLHRVDEKMPTMTLKVVQPSEGQQPPAAAATSPKPAAQPKPAPKK